MALDPKDIQAFVRAIAEDPQARAELARALMSDELRQVNSSIDRLADGLARLTQSHRALTDIVARLADTLGDVKGKVLELDYARKGHAYFAPIALRLRVLDMADVDTVLDAAVDAGHLSLDETEEIRRADMFLRGRRRDDGTDVYLVVETSSVIDESDVERAASRAALLRRAGVGAEGVVAGAVFSRAGQEAARRADVWRVTDGRAEPPPQAV